MLIGAHVFLRGLRLPKGVNLIDREAQFFAFDRVGEVSPHRARFLSQFVHRARAMRHPDISDAPVGMQIEVELGLAAAKSADVAMRPKTAVARMLPLMRLPET